MSQALCNFYQDYQIQHSIKPSDLDSAALDVVVELEQAGFDAFLVGGCIRDVVAGFKPKDFDVATNATPEQVAKALPKARIIGRRFKIAHVRRGREIIEVTTFRGHASHQTKTNNEGRLLRDNNYGTMLEDAQRRDFTINALYYHPSSNTLLDFCNGIADIESRTLRILGDASKRYAEDPVRMLRAIRFSAKLDFSIERHTHDAIKHCGFHLGDIPPARLFDEVLKLLMSGYGPETFALLRQEQLFQYLFSKTDQALNDKPGAEVFIIEALKNTDVRIHANKPVTPAYLYAALMWPARKQHYDVLLTDGLSEYEAGTQADMLTTEMQQKNTAIPKRFSIPLREIWSLQTPLEKRARHRCAKLLRHPRFRAAYDFLLLRNQAGEDLQALCDWWTTIQERPYTEQQDMIQALYPAKNRRVHRH